MLDDKPPLELYHECLDNGGWARMLCEVLDRIESCLSSANYHWLLLPLPLHRASPDNNWPVRRHTCKTRQREAWAERRRRKVEVASRPTFPVGHTGNAVVHAAAAPFTAAIMDPKSTALLVLPHHPASNLDH
jgi:hypothetical protein